MTQIMSHGFHGCELHEHMICFMSFDWLKDISN